MKSVQKNLNISPLTARLFPRLADHYGISQSDLLEMLLLNEARSAGLGYLIEQFEKEQYQPGTQPGHH